MADLDVLKDIPGYKAILKSVLKSQIQLLLEQLSENTAEESIILTASVNDGTLSHLGSSTGKGFLEGRDEIKSQFLGYCLKTHHKQTTQEPKSPYQSIQPKPPHLPQPHPVGNIKRSRFSTPPSAQRGNPYARPIQPKPSHRRPSNDNIDTSFQTDALNRSVQDHSSDLPVVIKQEGGASHNVCEIDPSAPSAEGGGSIGGVEGSTNFPSTPVSFPSSLSLSHTQTSGDPSTQSGQNDNDSSELRTDGSEAVTNLDSSVKIEPITENEMELEITGVEMGDGSMGQEQWGQLGYSSEGDNSFTNQSGDHLQFRAIQHKHGSSTGQSVSTQSHPPKESRTKLSDIVTSSDHNLTFGEMVGGLVDIECLGDNDTSACSLSSRNLEMEKKMRGRYERAVGNKAPVTDTVPEGGENHDHHNSSDESDTMDDFDGDDMVIITLKNVEEDQVEPGANNNDTAIHQGMSGVGELGAYNDTAIHKGMSRVGELGADNGTAIHPRESGSPVNNCSFEADTKCNVKVRDLLERKLHSNQGNLGNVHDRRTIPVRQKRHMLKHNTVKCNAELQQILRRKITGSFQ